MSPKEKIAEGERLIVNVANAAFDCGEWCKDCPETYEQTLNRSVAAQRALREFITEIAGGTP